MKCLYQMLVEERKIYNLLPNKDCLKCPYDNYGVIVIIKHDSRCPDYVEYEEKSK